MFGISIFSLIRWRAYLWLVSTDRPLDTCCVLRSQFRPGNIARKQTWGSVGRAGDPRTTHFRRRSLDRLPATDGRVHIATTSHVAA